MATGVASATMAARGFTQAFDNRAAQARPFWPQMAKKIDSSGLDEKYGWFGGMPGIREWLGERKFKEINEADFTITNKLWESSVIIEQTVWEDNRIPTVVPMIEALADEAMYHPDELMIALMVANGLCFDGQNFYDVDHVWDQSGTQSNSLTLNAATGTTPTPTEFRQAYNAAFSAILGFKGDNGKPLYRPTVGLNDLQRPLVLVPPALLTIAADGLNARFDTNNNPITVQGNPELVAIPYLTDATKFYVINRNTNIPAFVFQARRPLRRQAKHMNDGDIEFKHIKLMVDARYNVGYMAWWNSVLTTFT